MASLIEKAACDGLLPISIGGLTLTQAPPARIASVAPFNGREKAVVAALKAQGLAWPAPGRCLAKGDAAILWSGRGQAFLLNGDTAGLAGIAAVTDQTDGWAALRLSGPGHADALARLVPLDLRPAAFPPGSTARSGLGHMMAVFRRLSPDAVEIMVFRSMAATAVHEITVAMQSVTARHAI